MSDDIAEVARARVYIDYCRKHVLPRGAAWVDTSSGRRILLDEMTDADALFVAAEFRRWEETAAQRFKGRKQ